MRIPSLRPWPKQWGSGQGPSCWTMSVWRVAFWVSISSIGSGYPRPMFTLTRDT